MRRGWAGTGEATGAGCACSSPHAAPLRRPPRSSWVRPRGAVLTRASKRELAGQGPHQFSLHDDKPLPEIEQILVSDPQAWPLSRPPPGVASQASPGPVATPCASPAPESEEAPSPALCLRRPPRKPRRLSLSSVLTLHEFTGDIHQV